MWAIGIVIDHLQGGNAVKGWAPLMIVVLFIGGFQMLMLGIIGEYIARTLQQVRGRDMYLIDAIHESATETARAAVRSDKDVAI
jgi:dolichol-phosphate mannosyltransferase